MREGESYIHGWFAFYWLSLIQNYPNIHQCEAKQRIVSYLPLDTSGLVELVIPPCSEAHCVVGDVII